MYLSKARMDCSVSCTLGNITGVSFDGTRTSTFGGLTVELVDMNLRENLADLRRRETRANAIASFIKYIATPTLTLAS